MNRIAVAFAACLASATPAFANALPPQDNAVTAAKDTVVAFMENFNAGNVEGVASTYSDSGHFVWVENGRVANADKAAAVADGIPKGARMETDATMQVVPVGGQAAEAIVPFTFYMKDDKGAEAEVFKGVMTLTIALDADGVFRIVAGHISTAGRE